ncbi:TPA: 3'-5' exoribonuclease [Acinetobacter baumannii]|nr:3'-5' exoribonuclease [Acinetobacter baumannii]
MNRLMLDFETLDVGECPVILSIGAVVFNEDEIIDCIGEKINQQSCLDIGCTISQETIKWWEKQSVAAKLGAFGGTTDIGYALELLVDLYKSHGCHEIWSKGSMADIRWANNILEKCGIDKPWKFSREMCFRTFLKYSPQVEFTPEGELHNALDDAFNQAKHWIAINKIATLNQNIAFHAVDLGSKDDWEATVSFDELGKMKITPIERLGNGLPVIHIQPEIDDDMPF